MERRMRWHATMPECVGALLWWVAAARATRPRERDAMALERLAREARMVEQAWAAAWAALGASTDEPRSVVDDLPDFLRVYTPGAPDMLLNLVMRYASAGPVSREAVEAVVAPYRRNTLPFQWWMTQDAEPAGLRVQMRALC